MGTIRMRSKAFSDNPELKAPVFNFSRYVADGEHTYYNNEEQIDFVTDGNSLYVCLSHDGVTPTYENIEDQADFLKLVSQGPQGIRGPRGYDGDSAETPRLSAEFDNDQLRVYINGEVETVSPRLTGKSWRPKLEDNMLVWELSNKMYAPEPIDLEELRPIQEKPLLLRVDSDNTKRTDEKSGPARFIQWKYEGDQHWTNLISISELMNLTLAGITIFPVENTETGKTEYHLGHKEVLEATYDSDKDGHRIISNVELGHVLFDAGPIPIGEGGGNDNDFQGQIDLIFADLARLDASAVKSVTINGDKKTPNSLGNVSFDIPIGAGDLSGYATENWVRNNYQPKGNYVKAITINNDRQTPNTNGEIFFTIGGTSLFNVRFDASTHKLQKTTDGQTWIDLVDLDDYTGGEGGGLTTAQVKSLIEQTLAGLLDPLNEYDNGKTNHNYFVRINELNSILSNYYTKGQVYSKGEIDQKLIGSVPHNRTFMIFKRSSNFTNETLPNTTITWNVSEGVLDIPVGSNGWTEHPENASGSNIYLWVAYGTFESLHGELVGSWDGPFCLTGENGKDGEDGNGVEFIYHLGPMGANGARPTAPSIDYTKSKNYNDNTTATRVKSWWATEESEDSCPGDGNNGYWTDDPQGIDDTENAKVEWASVRRSHYDSVNKVTVWEDFCAPFIWSMWGEDGVDGAGVEYIFAVAAENETIIDPVTNKRELSASFFRGQNALQILPLRTEDIASYENAGGNYQIDDWCPDGTIKSGVQMQDLNWSDNPSDVGPDQPYEFVAIRKRRLDPVSGKMKWGPFSTPALWGFWGTTTIYQTAQSHFKPYTCFAFTRSATDIKGYTVVNPWTYANPSQTYAEWIAADPTREDGYYDNPLRYIVTLDDNNQVVPSSTLTWSDTIPAPPGQLYMITNHIGDEASSSDQGWTSPREWGDAAGFQVEYARADENTTDNVYDRIQGYTLPKLDNYDLDNYPNLNDPDNDGIDEAAWRTAVENAGMGVWGDEDDIADPDYMATCYKKQEGVWSNWQISRIKGEKGQDGIDGTPGSDGNSIEFVYYRTKGAEPGIEVVNELERGTYDPENASVRNKTDKDPELDKFFPAVSIGTKTDGDYWHDHPKGVTEVYTHEWVAMRTSAIQDGRRYWSSNFSISLWSKFGANGRDGDGIEYVFWGLSKQDVQQITSTWPTQQASNNINNGANVDDPNNRRPDKNGKFITDNKYLPAILINNVGREAVDNNPGIENNEYVYASMRRYNGSTHTWGEFGEIKLWNEQNNQDLYSVVLDIEDDTHPVFVDEDGRITDRRMSYTYSTDNMYLYKDLVLIGNGDVYIVNSNNTDIKIAELIPDSPQSNCYNLITSSNGIPVSSNGITAKVYPTYAWKYENSNSSKVELKVVFDQVSNENPILTNSFDITIKVKSADGNYTGSDLLRLVPKYVEKEVELSSVPGTQRTAEEGGKTYSDSEFRFSGWYGDVYTPLSLVADTTFYFKYDDQANWTKFKIPVNNSYLATLKNTVDGITEGDGYFYFDRTGTFISAGANNTHVNGEFFRIWLYNTDYKDNNHGTWTNWNIIAYVHISAFTATEDYPIDELYFGIGFDGNEPIDEANVHIIYPGKNGSQGPQGPQGPEGPQGPQGPAGETVVTHQYLDGKVVRLSDWTDDRLAYSSGSTAINGVYYLDVVRYISGSTTSYYKCKSDVTYTSSNKPSDPSTDSTHWEEFTPQSDAWFETMLANSAYIKDLTVDHLNTAGEDNNSLERIAIAGNTMYATDSNGYQKFIVTGDNVSASDSLARYPILTKNTIYFTRSTLNITTRSIVLSNIKIEAGSTIISQLYGFTINAERNFTLPNGYFTPSLILVPRTSGSSITIASETQTSLDYLEPSMSFDVLTNSLTTPISSEGVYDLILEIAWNIENTFNINEFTFNIVPDESYLDIITKRNCVSIGANGIVIKLSDDFKAIFNVENSSPNILIQGKNSSNDIIGLKINATDGIKINNGDGWKNIATTS